MPPSIIIENLSKQYRLGVVGTGTLSHDLKRWWTINVRGKEDPYFKIGETNDRTAKGQSEYVWALKDINLEVESGEVLGIIGKNGAGKSTLLKILSKVTRPSTGTIKYRGKIASLLEVGTGFHPEMTGRENIFMNGAIMGMNKAEITRKFEEIVSFSGIDRYIDTPVKRYSSGMTVRLGFSIAAHLEPDILIVDEVLAVGDAEFQKKCLGKMDEVSKQGRTVLFVSHNLPSISALCKKGLLISNGQISFLGETSVAISKYLDSEQKGDYSKELSLVVNRNGNGLVQFTRYSIVDDNDKEIEYVFSGQNITFVLDFKAKSEGPLPPLHFSLHFFDQSRNPVFHISNSVSNGEEFIFEGNTNGGTVTCNIPKLPLHQGDYYFDIYCGTFREVFDQIVLGGKLVVEAGDYYNTGQLPLRNHGCFLVENGWTLKNRF